MDILLSLLLTLVIIFIVPMIVYGALSSLLKMEEPNKKISFFAGVLIEKIGTTLGFVTLFYIGREIFLDKWFTYALVWFVMFAITEIGQVFTNNYSKKEAIAGILSEAIYFPLAVFILTLILK